MTPSNVSVPLATRENTASKVSTVKIKPPLHTMTPSNVSVPLATRENTASKVSTEKIKPSLYT